MPLKTFTAGATFTATANQFLPTALNLSVTKIESYAKDTATGTFVVGAAGEQIIYQTSETTTPLVYIFVQADSANATGSANELALVYSGSSTTTIGKLKPGDWVYLPYSGSNTTVLKVINPGSSVASVNYLYAESGSGG